MHADKVGVSWDGGSNWLVRIEVGSEVIVATAISHGIRMKRNYALLRYRQ